MVVECHQQDHLVHQDPTEKMVLTVNLEHLVKTDLMDHQPLHHHSTTSASTAPMDPLDHLEILDQRDLPETLEQMDNQEHQDRLELQDLKDHPDLQEMTVSQETQEHLEHQDNFTRFPAPTDPLDHLDLRDHLDPMDNPDPMDSLDSQVPKVHLETTVQRELPDNLELTVTMDQMEKLDLLEDATTALHPALRQDIKRSTRFSHHPVPQNLFVFFLFAERLMSFRTNKAK